MLPFGSTVTLEIKERIADLEGRDQEKDKEREGKTGCSLPYGKLFLRSSGRFRHWPGMFLCGSRQGLRLMLMPP